MQESEKEMQGRDRQESGPVNAEHGHGHTEQQKDGTGHEDSHSHEHTEHHGDDHEHTEHHGSVHEHSHSHEHTHHGTGSHSHRKHHKRHKTETPEAARRKKKVRAAAFVVLAASLVLTLRLSLERVESFFVEKKLEGTAPRTEEEMTEIPMYRQVQGKVKFNGTTYTYDHIIESWLLIGTDGSGNEDGEGEEYHGSLADFLALAVFDKTDRTYALLQLDRNTVADVKILQADGTGYASADMPLCLAHWYGGTPEQGCENTVDAVSRLLGKVKIDGYYCLGMDDIGALNHAVGGVEVTIEDDFSKEDPSLKLGEKVLLDDSQAVSFVRGRMSVGDGSNTGRLRRQRQYLEAYLAKVKEKTRESSSFINDLYNQLRELAVTTMKGRDLSRLAKRVDQGESLGIYTIDGTSRDEYFEEEGLYHTRFYPEEGAIEEVMTELYHLKKEDSGKD